LDRRRQIPACQQFVCVPERVTEVTNTEQEREAEKEGIETRD
jgi:hypothetical protein